MKFMEWLRIFRRRVKGKTRLRTMNFRFWNLSSNLKPFRNLESPPPSPSPSRGEGWGGGAPIRKPQSAFETGFPLIEIIIVIVILSIAAAITIKFLFDG